MTLEELLEEARERMESTHKPAALIAIDVIDAHFPRQREPQRLLMCRGLAATLNTDVADRRWHSVEHLEDGLENGKPRRSATMPRLVAEDSALWNTLYIGADGTSKSIMEFRVDDFAHLKDLASVQIAGWQRLKRRSTAGLRLLAEHKVEAVYELPAEAIKELEET